MRREKSSSIESGPLFTVADSSELDEGWREKTAAAMAAATLGYGALTNTNTPAPEPAKPTAAITQPTAPQVDADYARFQKTTPADLLDAAWAAGLRQDQLDYFIGQCATETKNYKRLEEDLNYTSTARLMQVFPKRIKNKKMAKKFIGNPEALANYVYANRNGNKYAGDGWKYRGRGYLMLTGRELYQQAGDALGLDLVNNPDLVLDPKIAARTAIWYWQSKVSKRIPDFSKTNVRNVTKHINPAMQGIKQRQAQYAKIAQR
jgi:putative chitinase